MKYILSIIIIALSSGTGFAQSPKIYDPCEKLDTNKLRDMLTGTWVDPMDTAHKLVITPDTLDEIIYVDINGIQVRNQSYFSYRFIDNFLSTDALTCYSIREFKEDINHHTDLNLNSVDDHYLLVGASGRKEFVKKR
jgi:hypothetical protein